MISTVGELHCLLQQVLVVVSGPDAEAGGKLNLCAAGKRRLQLLQGHIDLGGVDLRAARTLEPRRTSELADHCDRASWLRLQRQHVAGVLQQHRRLLGGAASQRMMIIWIEGGVLGECWLGLINKMQHPAHGVVEDGLVQGPIAYGGDDRGVADPEIRRHLKIKTAAQGRNPIMNRTPVGYHQTLEAPFLAQDLGQQPVVLRAVGAIQLVVGAHDRPRLRGLHDPLERRQIDLAEGPLVDLGTDPKSIILLIIRCIVLQRGADPLALRASHHWDGEFTGQPRIFGEILKVPPAQW